MARVLLGPGKATSYPDRAGKIKVEERVDPDVKCRGCVVYEYDEDDFCPDCEGCGCKYCKWTGMVSCG